MLAAIDGQQWEAREGETGPSARRGLGLAGYDKIIRCLRRSARKRGHG